MFGLSREERRAAASAREAARASFEAVGAWHEDRVTLSPVRVTEARSSRTPLRLALEFDGEATTLDAEELRSLVLEEHGGIVETHGEATVFIVWTQHWSRSSSVAGDVLRDSAPGGLAVMGTPMEAASTVVLRDAALDGLRRWSTALPRLP